MKIYSVLLFFILSSVGWAQVPEGVKSYAIIGAFEKELNAEKLSKNYKDKLLDAQVKVNQANGMYYVYVNESDDVEEVRSKVLELRTQFASLSEAWLYNGNFNCLHIPSDQLKKQEVSEESKGFGMEKLVHDVEEAEFEREERQAQAMSNPSVPTKKEKRISKPEGTYWVYFNVYNETDLNEISGSVKVFDDERDKEIGSEPTHELITLKPPNNGTNKVKFESDIFGYRTEERAIDLDEPLSGDSKDYISVVGDSIIVDFPLKRYNKGDFMTMWNVYFYIDAAIMKEESVLELNQLLDMMRDNDNIKIMIHGHTNGNSHGVVKHLDLDDKSFFSLNGSHLEDKASAKKLSEFRAYTIQHWLMDQGIAEERMEIKGWGGKKMIYDKHSSNADKNVRVEIEILEK